MSKGVGLLFPGQGAQAIGMGRAAFACSAMARDVYARADRALDYPLSRLCFEGPAEELLQTRWQQPAILACSLALLSAHEEREGAFAVSCMTGHSLGLYSALVVAKVLSLEEAICLVARRGELMQRAADECPGGMAAILGLDDATVEQACAAVSEPGDIVVVANYNAPGQVVISGAREALTRAMSALMESGARKIVPLAVAGAFHSPLMRAAAEALAPSLRAATLAPPTAPVIANASARALCDATVIREELLGQITAPVCWTAAMRFIVANGTTTLVDCGPSATLAGLLKRIAPEVTVIRLDGGGR